jgi:GT2 family glycosyltransferase
MVAFGGSWPWVRRALDALRHNTPESYEVILVDNGGCRDHSSPGGANVELVQNKENVGFGPASNQGAARARGDVLCLLNPDVLVEPGWLGPLLERAHEAGVGAAFPAKLNLDGTMQEAGAFVTGEGNAFLFGDGEGADAPQYAFRREVDFGSAAAMCMTRSCFISAGGFDPAYRIAYYEDADLCFRLRTQGLRLVYEPRARVLHARSVSAPPAELTDVYAANRRVFLSRWEAVIEDRPKWEEIDTNPRVRLEARDLHASDRFLVLGADDAIQRLASELASALPRALVTLIVEQIDPSSVRALLGSGVEVVQVRDARPPLVERAGHYSHVVTVHKETPRSLWSVLRETQPDAPFLDAAEGSAAVLSSRTRRRARRPRHRPRRRPSPG